MPANVPLQFGVVSVIVSVTAVPATVPLNVPGAARAIGEGPGQR